MNKSRHCVDFLDELLVSEEEYQQIINMIQNSRKPTKYLVDLMKLAANFLEPEKKKKKLK